MRRILVVFCTAAILYLSVSYWYLPNSPYAHYSLQHISSPILNSFGTANNYFHKFSKIVSNLQNWFLSRAEVEAKNKKIDTLETEVQNLKIELSTTRKLIRNLEKLTNYKAPNGLNKISVDVYGAPIGFYESQLVTAAPSNISIKKDDVVVAEKGLVGRVLETSSKCLRLMLITDMSSRVPVKILETGENAIAAGNGTATLALEYLQSKEMITDDYKRPPAIGDILVTSGVGGIFPPNIPVGIVCEIKDKNQEISVKPFVVFHLLEIVTILYDTKMAL